MAFVKCAGRENCHVSMSLNLGPVPMQRGLSLSQKKTYVISGDM